MQFQYLLVDHSTSVARVTLNRPELHNAFSDEVIVELRRAFDQLAATPHVRVIVLAGAGKSFSAGADVNWMRRMVDYSRADNERDARAMAEMFRAIDRSPAPVIARVHGAALGGGTGLAAVADIAVAAESAKFALSEVRLGIIPAVISPYVLAKIGVARAREYFLTGERIDARRAAEIGLVAHVVPDAELDAEVARITGELLRSGPQAVSTAKALIRKVAAETDPDRVLTLTSQAIAERRASDEGQEGLKAFLEKRAPNWIKDAE